MILKNLLNELKCLIIEKLDFLNLYSPVNNLYIKIQPYYPWNIKPFIRRIRFYSKFVKKGDLCFDIGAHYGSYTRFLLRIGTKVVCVEPQRECLKKIYETYGKNKKVIIIGKAVGEKEQFSELFISESSNYISTLSNKWREKSRFSNNFKWTKTQKVEVTTLDNLIQEYSLPKFCKIDVEGFEFEVLKGLTKIIPIICFEFTRELFEDAKKCINYLKSLGDVLFNFVKGASTYFFLPKFVSDDKLYEEIDIIQDDLLWGDIYARFL